MCINELIDSFRLADNICKHYIKLFVKALDTNFKIVYNCSGILYSGQQSVEELGLNRETYKMGVSPISLGQPFSSMVIYLTQREIPYKKFFLILEILT